MDLLNIEAIANLTAAALVVVALYIMHLNNKAQNSAISAMSDATVKAIAGAFTSSLNTIQQSMSDQRIIHKQEIGELREEMARDRKEYDKEVSALKKRIDDLECEVEEKDKRIKSLETENTQLKAEIERMKGRLNDKQDKDDKQK